MHPSSFSNYNHVINHSKASQLHYHPQYYFHLEDQPIVREVFEQPFSNDHNHENLSLNTSGGDQFNNHMILKNDCLMGNRSSRKDSHSKINTARGPRDRRMRLSLDVAKKFFRLQDMLGFDKASNTIEWLLMKSKPDIRDLITQKLNQSCSLLGVSNSASGSECEVLSGIDDQSVEKTRDDDNQVTVTDDRKENFTCWSNINKENKKRVTRVRKNVYIRNSLAKETREKARARARKRTTEKRNIKLGYDQYTKSITPSVDQVMDQNTNRLGSWVPFGENQVQTIDHTEYPNSHFQFKQGIVGDNASIMSTNWSPSFLQFNYHHNLGPSSHEHQFINDFQIPGKPWEGISASSYS